uniref:J domain-containing protein n=1 Tax=Salix viminalis TaxID=40686 RepID=A0A6N2NJU6_SALVM
MECNKEAAFRVKEIAEKKFTKRDIAGARRFALKAQKLYPALDGLPQLLATLDVHMAADNRANGEVDWYRVLDVEPSASEDTIRGHYRKLALILHPDKNKSVGADGAFNIISEAWNLLSNKAKRIAYDRKRNVTDMDQKVPHWKSSVPTGHDNNFNARSRKSSMHPKPAPPPLFSNPNTFWTICNACKTQFEFLRTYLNHSLLCQNCHQPFLGVERPPPSIDGNDPSPMWTSYSQEHNSTRHVRTENPTNMGPKFQSGAFSKDGGFGSAQSMKLKRKHEEEFLYRQTKTVADGASGFSSYGSSSVLKGDKLQRRRCIDEQRANSHGRETAKQVANRNGESGSQNISLVARRRNNSGIHKVNSTCELSQIEIRKMLMEKAKKDISKKVKEWSSVATALKTSEKGIKEEGGKQKDGTNADVKESPGFLDSKRRAHTTEPSPINANDDPDTNISDRLVMSVPDPDFHDFDKDRTENSFGDNQVWAAYDDDDGMPRYYAMIHSVISRKPFKMRISWLNTKTNHELGPLNWIGSGFYKTSGDFWIGKHKVNKSLNSFSHKVKWVKSSRGAIQIYPGKGDVWAIYKNWSPSWNERTPDEVIHKYDMVEVLEDYKEERGVVVTPLVKVAGFKTVFRRHPDSSKTRTIPREEMFRFSHQVPSVLLTGQEGQNAPKGCWELDPASTPLELLQVLSVIQLDGMMETAEKDKENYLSGDMIKFNEEEFAEYVNTVEEKGVVGKAARGDVADARKNKRKEGSEDTLMVYKRR